MFTVVFVLLVLAVAGFLLLARSWNKAPVQKSRPAARNTNAALFEPLEGKKADKEGFPKGTWVR